MENGLNRTLDVSFGDDGSVVRVGHVAENVSTLAKLLTLPYLHRNAVSVFSGMALTAAASGYRL